MSLDQRRKIPVVYVRETSEAWTRHRFRATIAKTLDEDCLAPVEERRRMLRQLAPGNLPPVYNERPGALGRQYDAASISIPRLYGHILFALASELRPKATLEAGSGFGLSGMYLGSALGDVEDAVFFTFELGDCVGHARDSIARVCPKAFVIHDSASNFAQHVASSVQFDLVFLDAVHEYDAIMRDVKLLRGWMSPAATLLIDDVSYSASSRRAWKEIATMPEVRFSALVNERLGFVSWQ